MPKPPYPIPGDPISANWGTDLLDYASEGLRFVRNPAAGSFQINSVTGSSTPVLVELTQLPMNDPMVWAADVSPIFRCSASGGQGQNARLFDYQATAPPDSIEKARNYWSGVGGRGGGYGAVILRVGGVNNRQIWYRSDSCDSNGGLFWLIVNGWWIAEIGPNSAMRKESENA